MNKKLFIVLTLVVFWVGSSSAVYGNSPVKLLLNERELKSDVPPEIMDGRLLVPARIISEALGADVIWNEKDSTVEINAQEPQSTELPSPGMQVQQLESFLKSKDPLTTAEKWAEAVKLRNGAVQYALMSPELRKQQYTSMVENNWSTGVSSPWVESYTVNDKEKIDNETYLYEISFTYNDSTQTTFVTSKNITVKKYQGHWLVSSINKESGIRGEIIKITSNDTAVPTISFLVEDKTAEQPYDKAQITIKDDTKIYRGETKEVLSIQDLKEGATVEVVFSGPALTSYPVRVGAGIIRLYE